MWPFKKKEPKPLWTPETQAKIDATAKMGRELCAMVNGVEGRKDDGGKLRYDLVPTDAFAALVEMYTVGAANYGPRNWENGISYCRIFAALMRHCWSWFKGEENDPDDGLHHMVHAAWNCMTLLAYSMRGMKSFDDRPTTKGSL